MIVSSWFAYSAYVHYSLHQVKLIILNQYLAWVAINFSCSVRTESTEILQTIFNIVDLQYLLHKLYKSFWNMRCLFTFLKMKKVNITSWKHWLFFLSVMLDEKINKNISVLTIFSKSGAEMTSVTIHSIVIFFFN